MTMFSSGFVFRMEVVALQTYWIIFGDHVFQQPISNPLKTTSRFFDEDGMKSPIKTAIFSPLEFCLFVPSPFSKSSLVGRSNHGNVAAAARAKRAGSQMRKAARRGLGR